MLSLSLYLPIHLAIYICVLVNLIFSLSLIRCHQEVFVLTKPKNVPVE